MWYKIIPKDTLFFRDGKPFTMGSETWGETIFPPYPSTVYGAIRSWLIFERGSLEDFLTGKFEAELGIKNKKGSLCIKGPFLMTDELNFVPPLDLVIIKDKKGTKAKDKLYQLYLLHKPEIFISDYPLENILIWQKSQGVEEAEGYLSLIYFKSYLKGKNNIKIVAQNEFLIHEPKTGIARERLTGTVKEAHLYRVPMIRLKDKVSILIKIEGINDIPQEGIIQLGGEGKTAKIKKTIDFTMEIENIDIDISNQMFKIYFATPSIFENGWLPKWIDKKTFKGEYKGINLQLIGACIGRYKLIGGWDLANNRPKPMRKAIPAGSVYYFRILDNINIDKIIDAFHFKNISDIFPEEGFGLALIGEVKI